MRLDLPAVKTGFRSSNHVRLLTVIFFTVARSKRRLDF